MFWEINLNRPERAHISYVPLSAVSLKPPVNQPFAKGRLDFLDGAESKTCSVRFMTDLDRLVRIERQMSSFRNAAFSAEIGEAFAGYRRFPFGSCTWASFAFGLLLKELEPGEDWHLVNGLNHGVFGGHDWLEDGHLAVDITADQFLGERPFVGLSPPPVAQSWPSQNRIDLSSAHEPHRKALIAIRKLMPNLTE